MGYAVRAKPIAATLEKLFVGQRSGVRPFALLVFSQNQSKVRLSSVSRKAVWRGVIVGAGWVAGVVVTGPTRVEVQAPVKKNRVAHSLKMSLQERGIEFGRRALEA